MLALYITMVRFVPADAEFTRLNGHNLALVGVTPDASVPLHMVANFHDFVTRYTRFKSLDN